jgi:hypothetical protein
VLVQQEFQRAVATEFRATPGAISNVVRRAQKDPGIFERLRLEAEEKLDVRAAVQRTVPLMHASNMVIESAAQIVQYVHQLTGTKVDRRLVLAVLKEDVGAKFRRIQKVPLHLNTVRNLILRQQWAIKYMELVRQKTWLNIDESWLSESNFLRRKWRMPGCNNAVPVHMMAPRVSLIVGLSSTGDLYATLTQVNSNSSVMQVFFHHLAAKLDREDRDWRRKTIILLDGASYHQSAQILKVFKYLRLPIMFLGPNSYATAVCEMVFAALKTVDLNPQRLPLGKK